jgi:hypothetical protein
MPYKFKAVSAQTKLLIDYSNKVIQKCRAIVAMGAGNQRDDVRRTQGRANYLSRVTQSDPNYVWNRPLRSGSVTCAYGSGTCQDQSGVTYTILRSKLNNTHTISLCVHNAIGHQFATIGIPGIDPANEVVCVDPWPIRCQAVLLEDHFCWPGLTVLRSKPAGKQASYQTRLQKWAPPNATAVRQYADAHVWPVQVSMPASIPDLKCLLTATARRTSVRSSTESGRCGLRIANGLSVTAAIRISVPFDGNTTVAAAARSSVTIVPKAGP